MKILRIMRPVHWKLGQQQKYESEFLTPKFDADGKKTANARFVKVVLNGQVLHENVEISSQHLVVFPVKRYPSARLCSMAITAM